MPVRLGLAVSFSLTLAAESTASVAPPDPGEVKEFDSRDGSSIFRMRFSSKPYDGPLALCAVCGRPLAQHTEANFVCRPAGRNVKEAGLRRARCPVCAHEFEAPVPDPDPGGRLDRDFCRHQREALARVTNVWMCPRCGYATFHRDFSRPLADDVRAFVRETIMPGTQAKLSELMSVRLEAFGVEDFGFLKQTTVPEFLKYENAWAVAVRRGASHRELARLYLEASHAYRRLMNQPVVAKGLDRSIRRIERLMVDPLTGAEQGPAALARAGALLLERTDSEKRVKLTSRDRLFLSVRMAGLHDRLGEVWWTSRYLRRAEELASREPDEVVRPMLQDLVRRRAAHLSRETYHQARAAEHFKRALAGGEIADSKERLLTIYLVGELLTRTGEIAKAIPWFDATVTLAQGGEKRAVRLSGWARDRLASAAFQEEGRRVAADPDEKTFVDGLAGRHGAAAEPVSSREAPAEPAASTKPASCREQLTNIWKAIEAYRDLRGEFPPDLKSIVTREFVCVESGSRLFYRRPRPGASRTFIIFHKNPTTCPCRNVLYSDGTVRELGR